MVGLDTGSLATPVRAVGRGNIHTGPAENPSSADIGDDVLSRLDEYASQGLDHVYRAIGFDDFNDEFVANMCADLAQAVSPPGHQALCGLLRRGALPTLHRLERAPPRALTQALLSLAQARPYALCEAALVPLFYDHDKWTGGHQTLFNKVFSGKGEADGGNAGAAASDVAAAFLELWAEEEPRRASAGGGAWTLEQIGTLEAALKFCARLSPPVAAGLAGAAEKQARHQQRSLPFCKLLLTLVQQHGELARPHCDVLLRAIQDSKAFLAKSVASALKRLGKA
jgi:hypothetical protein